MLLLKCKTTWRQLERFLTACLTDGATWIWHFFKRWSSTTLSANTPSTATPSQQSVTRKQNKPADMLQTIMRGITSWWNQWLLVFTEINCWGSRTLGLMNSCRWQRSRCWWDAQRGKRSQNTTAHARSHQSVIKHFTAVYSLKSRQAYTHKHSHRENRVDKTMTSVTPMWILCLGVCNRGNGCSFRTLLT